MKKKLIIIIAIAAIASVIGLAASKTDPLDNINVDSIIEPSENTGWIGEKIIGNPDTAKVVIYEYADFSCSHCAEADQKVNDLVAKYNDEVALVFRSYNTGNFKNTLKVATAATAAQIQGYFKAYKDLLYLNQDEWFDADGEKLSELLLEYFLVASDGRGDLEKFKEDIKSDSVNIRLKFEQKMGKKVGLTGTPTFRINGENTTLSELEKVVAESIH